MRADQSEIVKKVKVLLKRFSVSKPPIPVESIAKRLGARVTYEPFEGNLSGMLYRKNSLVIIGVNTLHPEVRQRFTIAHEIGHWQLQEKRDVIVDRLVRLNFRDDKASTATDDEEIDANAFAAELLMPREMIDRELLHRGVKDEEDVDELVSTLAMAFNVSAQAMEYRLVNLGIRGHV